MPMMLPERLRRPIEIFHAALRRTESLELSAGLAATPVSPLISSSRIPGTMITARGRLRFSNRANLIASARLKKMPPHWWRWSWTTQWPRLFRPSRSIDVSDGNLGDERSDFPIDDLLTRSPTCASTHMNSRKKEGQSHKRGINATKLINAA